MTWNLRIVTIAVLVGSGAACAAEGPAQVPAPVPEYRLAAGVVATGLNRAYGIRQVGRFHAGGPFSANPEFLLQTQPGRVLDPARVLVALGDNLGARTGNPAHAAGAVVSIDPRAAKEGQPLGVPADLAVRQVATRAPVQLYSAQAGRYMNRQHNAQARTAEFAGTSGPRYLSINNAFGRPWIANAPFGTNGPGSESVLDPDGAPLQNAPSDAAGGVFVGAQSGRTSTARAVRAGGWASWFNRRPSGQLTPGAIDRGALGTALLGASPDGSGFAVFAVVTGAGAVVQAHVQDGIDGLAPPGTIDVGSDDPGVIGIAFKWNPERMLYIADARRNRIVVLRLSDDTLHFVLAGTSGIESPWLKRPVDLAACVPEIANPRFASHTTLAGGSDLYVVNRGDGSVLRMRQDGTVLARAVVAWPDGRKVGGDRLRSIAVSADAQRLWLIAQQPDGSDGTLLELSGFDAGGAFGPKTDTAIAASRPADHAGSTADGARLFVTPFTATTGLGPHFNAESCVACHPGPGGASVREEHFARRIAYMDPGSGRIVSTGGQASAFAPRRSLAASGQGAAPFAELPRAANVVSLRMPLALRPAARLDEIPDAVIEAQATSKGDGIKGRAHYVTAADGTRRVGRYGWKADVARLDEMVAEALGNEMGVTSALATRPAAAPKDDGTIARAIAAFVRTLGASPPSPRRLASAEARR